MSRTIARNPFATSLGAAAGALAVGVALAVGGPAGPATAAVGAAAESAQTTARTMTAVDPNDALLRAAQLPEVNEVQRWRKVAKRKARVSNAQPEPLSALGATDRARRDFAMPGGTASSAVLTFEDSETAAEAYTEVRSWRKHTSDNVPADGRLLFTSKHSRVAVDSGRASYFSFVFKTDRSSEEGTFEWLGVTRRGAALSIVAWRVGGQDATYEVDPTIAPVQAANERLARLG